MALLIQLLTDNPDISRKDILARLGVKRATFRRYMMKLNELNLLPEGAWEKHKNHKRSHQRRQRERRKGMVALLLIEDPSIPKSELIKGLGLTLGTVNRYIAELHREGRLPEGVFKISKSHLRARAHSGTTRRKPRARRKLSQAGRRTKLLQILRKNPRTSVKELASILNVSLKTVQRDRSHLRKIGAITVRNRKLRVNVHPKIELMRRKLLQLIKDNPGIRSTELAARLKVSKGSIKSSIKHLKRTGDLPASFKFRNKSRYNEQEAKTLGEARAARKPLILKGVSENLTYGQIADSMEIGKSTVAKDLMIMRRINDPALREAKWLRRGITEALKRKNKKSVRSDILHKQADEMLLETIGLTLSQVNHRNREWLESHDTDDNIART